jgi:hypothetical protein
VGEGAGRDSGCVVGKEFLGFFIDLKALVNGSANMNYFGLSGGPGGENAGVAAHGDSIKLGLLTGFGWGDKRWFAPGGCNCVLSIFGREINKVRVPGFVRAGWRSLAGYLTRLAGVGRRLLGRSGWEGGFAGLHG